MAHPGQRGPCCRARRRGASVGLGMLCGLVVGVQARAASLDNLEVGGAWGTPAATDATALWWNPAGVAAQAGTRLTVDVAPTFAVIDIQRSDPNGGSDQVKLQGAVPFAGVVSDLGVDGLGLGLGFGVPFVRGGTQTPQGGPVRYHLRDGHIQTAAVLAGAAYRYRELVSVGVGAQLMVSSWGATLDNELMPDLSDQIGELGQDAGYSDADLEDPDYAATLDFTGLSAVAPTFSAGLRVQPDPHIVVSLAWLRGVHLDHKGDVSLDFSCPPQSDTLGRFGAESRGLCDATLQGAAQVSYDLPGRVHGSVQILPVPDLKLELMGGLVFWHVLRDYRIQITDVADRNTGLPQPTVDLVERDQLWARDNQDSYWFGLDAKGSIRQRLTLGGRLLYDQAAVPDAALLANNYDANSVILGGLVAGKVLPALELGLSWSHTFLVTRTVTDSAFSMSVDPALRPEVRYNYPHGNGTYGGGVDRLGLSARLAL